MCIFRLNTSTTCQSKLTFYNHMFLHNRVKAINIAKKSDLFFLSV